jgi:CubicO group peptidase (beta-lactamase class C family)
LDKRFLLPKVFAETNFSKNRIALRFAFFWGLKFMINKRFLRIVSAFCLTLALTNAALPTRVAAQAVQTTANYSPQLNKIAEKIEKRRTDLGVPGIALAIVKDDKIIFSRGFGYKDFKQKTPVTPDTQFGIGSATKAFTALAVLMSQEAGKLNLDDNPKKYLPYFKINDPETDARITIRDLLSHSSGLNRTDLAMMSGKLSREELIKVAGEAKPVAKLREHFEYQNVMFAAAGEIVARTNNTSWEKFVSEKIFKPLEMTNSNVSVDEMKRAKDFALGYDYNADTKETRFVPLRDIASTAPAGAINSSANDMAKWISFMLNGGATADGKRLVSGNLFAELTKPQMKIAGKTSYGLGWFVQDFRNLKLVQHGGNIDGFTTMVAMIPERKTGFVMLVNQSNSSLPSEAIGLIFNQLLFPQTAAPVSPEAKPESEIGKYRFEAAKFDIEIKMADGKLTMNVPGQPVYTLENVGGRKYKLNGAPDGFFITFKDTEAYLEQPQGNFTLPKVKSDGAAAAEEAAASKDLLPLVGKYASEQNPQSVIEIAASGAKVLLVVPNQPEYELREKSKDVLQSPILPDAYSIKVRRGERGEIDGIILIQPEGEFAFKKLTETAAAKPSITVDELMAKVLNALGGEANWRKIKSRVARYDIDFVNQGVKGSGTIYAKVPNLTANELAITALGKVIGTSFEYFDGTKGGQFSSFAEPQFYTGKQLENARLQADFYGLLDWKKNYKTVTLKAVAKIGDEDVWAIVFEPENGSKETIYFSQKTFLPIKRESVIVIPTAAIELPFSETYADYREIDKIMIPFRVTSNNSAYGDVVTTLKEVKQNVTIDDKIFQPKQK